MQTFKTPGVYVQEIATFPPSVAEVETAIPAFIGYTETAMKDGVSLAMKAVKISSMVMYEQYFGKGFPISPAVVLDDTKNIKSVSLGTANFCMYESMRLFFDNGGGQCYIVSVGSYEDTPSIGSDTAGIQGGLKLLEQEDEPTILLAPDTAFFTDTNRSSFHQKALDQCGKLMDRVAICDLGNNGNEIGPLVESFRNTIGINNLKYGAAYAPWLRTNYPKYIRYRDIELHDTSGGTIKLEDLTTDQEMKTFISQNLLSAIDTVDTLTSIRDAAAANTTLKAKFEKLVKDYNDASATQKETNAKWKTLVSPIYTLFQTVLKELSDVHSGLPNPANLDFKMKNDVATVYRNNDVEGMLKTLLYYNNSTSITNATGKLFDSTELSQVVSGVNTIAGTSLVATVTDAGINTALGAAATDTARGNMVVEAAKNAFPALLTTVNDLLTVASNYEKVFEGRLPDLFALYKNMLNKINETASEVPPSGAIAGIYARVDRERGVWKAPANVSISSIIGPSLKITDNEQVSMNVDTNAGKSVNAIRAFAGKGVLVWGARTLAGNDNEWRYVPVRRFYNMVEESVKKSTSWAVFEPNDANTWIKVKSMIENYLTQKWREGALMGARADDAFFVKIGLGITMSAQDILEGRMNVEIGMAVVRPAEFIILKFSHKLMK